MHSVQKAHITAEILWHWCQHSYYGFTDSFPQKPQDFSLGCCSLGFLPKRFGWIWQIFQPSRL